MRVDAREYGRARRSGRATSVRVAPTGTAVEQYQVPLGQRHSLKEAGVIGLPSWSEKSTQNETWVRVPRLSATCPRRVVAFDGGKSSIDKTMEFGDDFDGAAMDTAKWALDEGSAPTISNSALVTLPGTVVSAKTLASTEGTRTVFRLKSTQIGGTSNSYQIIGARSGWASLCRAQYTQIGSEGIGYINTLSGIGSSLGQFASTPSANVWFTHSLTRDGSGAAKWQIDDGAVTTWSSRYPGTVAMGPYIGRDGSGTTPVLSIDYTYVRKYVANEPLAGSAQPSTTNRALSRPMSHADLMRAVCA